MTIYKMLLLILGAYLLGSIPVAFLTAKWINGIDLRHYGSGTVSGSMVYEHVRHWLVIPVGLLDAAKAALPTWLALQWGLGETASVAAGTAALIGHNWPVYLKFTGGRGFSPLLGMLLVLFPWGVLWILVFLGTGHLLKDSAPWGLAGVASMPLPVWLLNGSAVLYGLAGCALVIMLAKRLEANRRPLPPPGAERRQMIWLRLIYDRDMVDHQAWIRRKF